MDENIVNTDTNMVIEEKEKTPIEILKEDRNFIFETFKDFPELLALYEEAQVLYAIMNNYPQFIIDVHTFVGIIQQDNFNIESFKNLTESILNINKTNNYSELSKIFNTYLTMKEECKKLT